MSAQLTDRELLEFAAKAGGYPIYSDAWACGPSGKTPEMFMGHRGPKWNPLTDDGDALRLAAALNMRVYVYGGGGDDFSVAANDELARFQGSSSLSECHNASDKLSATRRVIVRAAAEIGKAMP